MIHVCYFCTSLGTLNFSESCTLCPLEDFFFFEFFPKTFLTRPHYILGRSYMIFFSLALFAFFCFFGWIFTISCNFFYLNFNNSGLGVSGFLSGGSIQLVSCYGLRRMSTLLRCVLNSLSFSLKKMIHMYYMYNILYYPYVACDKLCYTYVTAKSLISLNYD